MFSKSDGATALHAQLVRALCFSKGKVEVSTPDGPEPALAGLAGVWNGEKGFVAIVVRRLLTYSVDRYVYNESVACEADLNQAIEDGLTFLAEFGFHMDPFEYRSLSEEQREQRLGLWNKLRKVRRSKAPQIQPLPEASVEPADVDEADLELAPPPGDEDESTPTEGGTLTQTPQSLDGPFVPEIAAAKEGAGKEEAQPEPWAPPHEAETEDRAEAEAADSSAEEVEPDKEPEADAAEPQQPPRRAVLARIELVRRDGEPSRPSPAARLLSFF